MVVKRDMVGVLGFWGSWFFVSGWEPVAACRLAPERVAFELKVH